MFQLSHFRCLSPVVVLSRFSGVLVPLSVFPHQCVIPSGVSTGGWGAWFKRSGSLLRGTRAQTHGATRVRRPINDLVFQGFLFFFLLIEGEMIGKAFSRFAQATFLSCSRWARHRFMRFRGSYHVTLDSQCCRTFFCRDGDSHTRPEWKPLSAHTHRHHWICFSKRNIFSTFSGTDRRSWRPLAKSPGWLIRLIERAGTLQHVLWNLHTSLLLQVPRLPGLVSFTLRGASGRFKLDEGEASGAEGPASVPRRRNLDRHATAPMGEGGTPHAGPSTSHLSTSECPAHRRVSLRHTPWGRGVVVCTRLTCLKRHTATWEDARGRLTPGSELPVTSLSSVCFSPV